MLLISLSEHEARDVLEIVEVRYQNAYIVFCSQFEPSGWYEQIGEATLADATLDRVIHSSHSIFIDGKISMRERLVILRSGSRACPSSSERFGKELKQLPSINVYFSILYELQMIISKY